MTPALPDIPLSTSSAREQAAVDEVSFGDGYAQRSPMGINSIKRSYEVAWELIPHADADALTAFFRARKGSEPFTWQPADLAAARKWVVKDWSRRRRSAAKADVTARFEEHFG